jgi:hypothetical protein
VVNHLLQWAAGNERLERTLNTAAEPPESRLVPTGAGSVESARCVIAWPQQAPLRSDAVPLSRCSACGSKGAPAPVGRGIRARRAVCRRVGLRFAATTVDTDVARLVEKALVASSTGRAETDGFNRLILAARPGWREVSLLRTVSRYLRQAGLLSQPYSNRR